MKICSHKILLSSVTNNSPEIQLEQKERPDFGEQIGFAEKIVGFHIMLLIIWNLVWIYVYNK